jgi:hypothetical protein
VGQVEIRIKFEDREVVERGQARLTVGTGDCCITQAACYLVWAAKPAKPLSRTRREQLAV